jgi:hypothetical protein
MPMAISMKPDYDQTVDDYGHGRCTTDGLFLSVCRVLKAQELLAVVKSDFDRPVIPPPNAQAFTE